MNCLPASLQVLYPFESRFCELLEGKLHYVDQGKGSPIIMLHGNPSWSFFYRNLIIQLRQSHRCLALDHLGCGLSDKPENGTYRLQDHIDRTVAWIENLGLPRFSLIVHDWGGAIGMGVARALWDRVDRICILNTAAFRHPSIPLRIQVCRFPLFGKILVQGFNGFARAATRMTTVSPLSDAVKEGYLFPYDSWKNRRAVHAFVKDIPRRPSHPSYKVLKEIEDFVPQLRDRPVQVHWGMQDWCFHSGILQQWKEFVPGATYFEYEAGHYLLEDAGSQVAHELPSFFA